MMRQISLTIRTIRCYQVMISPLLYALGARCRFHPSCSSYAMTAFSSHRWWDAARITCRRLLRCHPRNVGGIDYVPRKDCP